VKLFGEKNRKKTQERPQELIWSVVKGVIRESACGSDHHGAVAAQFSF
jgi:hypothetical protein